MPAPASAARAEPAAAPRPVPAGLPGQYAGWLARRGRGNRCFADGAAGFLRRWPDPQDFASEPLEVMLAQDQHTRPFITFLLLHDLLRPGYDYLADRKFAGLLDLARGTRLEQDLDGFQRAAAELGFSPHVCSRAAERVIARLLIQTGRRLHDLTAGDLRDAEAAFRARGERRGKDWSNDRGFLHAAWTVLFHLGIVEVTPPSRRRHERAGHARHFGGVPAWLAARLEDYTAAISGTHEDSTMDGIAIRLAHFGRHLAAADPDLDSLAGLDRQRHIETYLAATATARASRGGQLISAGEQRNRIIALGRFLADITEWQWPDAPARRLVFTRDIPKLPRALPRYLPADADRLITDSVSGGAARWVRRYQVGRPGYWPGATVKPGGQDPGLALELHRCRDGQMAGLASFFGLGTLPYGGGDLSPLRAVKAGKWPRSRGGAPNWPNGCGICQRPLFPVRCHFH